jgi:hypothetical protein
VLPRQVQLLLELLSLAVCLCYVLAKNTVWCPGSCKYCTLLSQPGNVAPIVSI